MISTLRMTRRPSFTIASVLAIFAAQVPVSTWAREPIIDMHVHALAADDQGPPPLAMCTPIDPMPTWDSSQPVMANFITPFKAPACADPIWSPETTEEVMRRSLDIMERNNVIGVVSGRMKLLRSWMEAAPARVMPSLMPDLPIPANFGEELGGLKKSGGIAVLGELGFQYDGIRPDDERLSALWAAAEANDELMHKYLEHTELGRRCNHSGATEGAGLAEVSEEEGILVHRRGAPRE